MAIKKRSVKQLNNAVSAGIEFLLAVHAHAPELKREVYRMPSERSLNALNKKLEKAFGRIEKKQKEIEAIEDSISGLLIDRKDSIQDAVSIAKTAIISRHPDVASKLGME